MVRKDGGLAASLAELTRLAHAQFVSSLQNRSAQGPAPCLVTSLTSSTSLYPTNLRSVCSVTAHLARLEGGGDLGPAPATAALLGLLRDVMAGAGHSVVEVSCDWSH